jgi:hypothetical protein
VSDVPADNPHAERIRTTFERNSRALELRAAIGVGTAVTRAPLRDGLTCAVTSTASEEDVMRVLDTADQHCLYLAVFANPQPLRREVRIAQTEAG